MTWGILLLLFFVTLMLVLVTGIPISFGFLFVNIIMSLFLMGLIGLPIIARSIFAALSSFTLVPIPLFILMGEVLFRSGVATNTIDAISKWIGKIPSRLSILTIVTGTLFASLSGSALANTATLGSLLLPEMKKYGYSRHMSAGPILAAGGLAMIIPPSAMAIIVGTIGEISIRAVLIGGIVPGILLSIGFITYYVVRGIAFPKEAPLYDVKFDSLKEKLISFFRDVFPLSFLIFAVVGFIFIGFATPTESAAVGVVGAYIIAFAYRKMTWNIFEESLLGAVKTSGMILMIMAGAIGFSQFLSFTGAARELAILVTNLQVAPILIVIVMLIIVTIMGCFLEQSAILMIVIPLFMPLIKALEFDPVWFGILLLINVCLANLTPPFGLALFVLKGVAQEYSLIDIIRDSIPVVAIMIAITLLILFIPSIATWLPEQMF